ncbi:MAG: tRNA (cytidine(34)-2'-O)-methyltransferase [Rhizobiales bacterium]|nr:tRNA (cytidine(34)-2'-O)-methyltransferase [Hyphomicrobiales bacterium]
MIEIALYQPDIAGNAGTIARMAACFGLPVTIIEPAGFAWTDSALRRAGMDYLAAAGLRRSPSWADFQAGCASRRVVLLTTQADENYLDFQFRHGDILLLGRESAGVPDEVHAAVQRRITIRMKPGMRSLNVAMACAMVTGEALRQLA